MYNFPARVGVSIEFETVAHLSKHPNIVGVKESSGDFSHALRMLQADFENFEVVCGCDDQPVDFFFWGAKSWIAGAANVFPAEQVALFEATQKGDWNHAKELMTACILLSTLWSLETITKKPKQAALTGALMLGQYDYL
ncbi:dihydrodipicolinate synthase [Psychrobacter sp. JCM 18900]|nr:dihydrodipicolinate synthase [Psychrobacter sp. JCM 18900]